MTINLEKKNNELWIEVEGRLDTNTAPALEKVFTDLDVEMKDVVLDMNQLEYISSAGLRVLLAAQKKMSKIGSLKLVGVCDSVMEIFEMTGFDDILTIEE